MAGPAETVRILGHAIPLDALATGMTGIVGAILGSVVTVGWTEFFNWRARRRDLKEKQRVGSFAMYQRLNRIYSDAMLMRKHIGDSIMEVFLRQIPVPFVSLRVMPMGQLSSDFEFTVDELWIATQVGGPALCNQVQALDHAHNMLNHAMAEYQILRNKAMAEVPTPQVWEDMNVGRLGTDDDEIRKLAPFFVTCDEHILRVHTVAVQTTDAALKALRGLVSAPTQPLGTKFAIALPDLDGKTITLKAADAVRRDRWSELRRKKPNIVPGDTVPGS